MALQVMGLPSVDDMMIDQRKRISKQASNEYDTTIGSLEIRSDRQVCMCELFYFIEASIKNGSQHETKRSRIRFSQSIVSDNLTDLHSSYSIVESRFIAEYCIYSWKC